MVVKSNDSIEFESESGYEGVKKKFFIGRKDGSNEIIMRFFEVSPQKSTPFHSHPFQHLVKIEKGNGVVINADKSSTPISAGSLVYIHDNEMHCFTNTSETETLEFICIVPDRGEK